MKLARERESRFTTTPSIVNPSLSFQNNGMGFAHLPSPRAKKAERERFERERENGRAAEKERDE